MKSEKAEEEENHAIQHREKPADKVCPSSNAPSMTLPPYYFSSIQGQNLLQVPGLVRPMSTSVPLQFNNNNNNNNNIHVVNTSRPAYSVQSNYGLNLTAKMSEMKAEMKDPAKRDQEDDGASTASSYTYSTSRHCSSSMTSLQFYLFHFSRRKFRGFYYLFLSFMILQKP